jgi:hypothetical protein
MIVSSNFVQFQNFALSSSKFLKIFGNNLDSFELQKFWTHNTKAMSKDRIFNIAITYTVKENLDFYHTVRRIRMTKKEKNVSFIIHKK